MAKLIGCLLARAGIKGFTGQDLRRTSTSHDEFLAMRLIRVRVAGTGQRYIRYPMAQLVDALEKYSTLRQAGEDNSGEQLIKKSPPPSNFPTRVGKTPEIIAAETINESGGDGGELNSPSRRSCPGHATGLVSSLILPDLLQLTELSPASR